MTSYRTQVVDHATQRRVFASTSLFCWDSIIEAAASWYDVAVDEFVLVSTDDGDKLAIGFRVVASIN